MQRLYIGFEITHSSFSYLNWATPDLILIRVVVLKLVMFLAKGIPIVGLQTDFRGSGEFMVVNLMLSNSRQHLLVTTPNVNSPAEFTYFKIGEDFALALFEVLSTLPAAQTARI